MWSSDSEDGWVYYANNEDAITVYKIRTNGSENQKVSDVRANELVVHKGWIYFSNYSYEGYLFKMKTDGSDLTMLTEFHVNDLVKKGDILYLKDRSTGQAYELPF